MGAPMVHIDIHKNSCLKFRSAFVKKIFSICLKDLILHPSKEPDSAVLAFSISAAINLTNDRKCNGTHLSMSSRMMILSGDL